MKKTLLSLAMTAALGFSSASAYAVLSTFPDFDVDTTPFSDAPKTFTADKITGNYSEVITFTSATTFDVSLIWQAGQFVKNDGNTVVPGGTSQLNTKYGLYATFLGTGTFTLGSISEFDLGSGAFNLYIDNDVDTSFSTPPVIGSIPWLPDFGTDGDDILIASGIALSGKGTLDTTAACSGGINCGSFGQTNTIGLTVPGKTFFVGPDPFYELAFESGQFNTFTTSGTQQINGSLDLVFQKVPEPTSLALFGLALAGLGVRRRRFS